jgi:hypothetical protein
MSILGVLREILVQVTCWYGFLRAPNIIGQGTKNLPTMKSRNDFAVLPAKVFKFITLAGSCITVMLALRAGLSASSSSSLLHINFKVYQFQTENN